MSNGSEFTPKGLYKIAGGKTEGRHPRLGLPYHCSTPKGLGKFVQKRVIQPFQGRSFEENHFPGVAVLRPYPRLHYTTPSG